MHTRVPLPDNAQREFFEEKAPSLKGRLYRCFFRMVGRWAGDPSPPKNMLSSVESEFVDWNRSWI